jgi:hypothetical protein
VGHVVGVDEGDRVTAPCGSAPTIAALAGTTTGQAPGGFYFGDGSDGSIRVTPTTVRATRDIHATSMRATSMNDLLRFANGFRVFVSGTMTIGEESNDGDVSVVFG